MLFTLNSIFFSVIILAMCTEILVPQPGIEPMTPALEVQSVNLWTAREIPVSSFFYNKKYHCLSGQRILVTSWVISVVF